MKNSYSNPVIKRSEELAISNSGMGLDAYRQSTRESYVNGGSRYQNYINSRNPPRIP